jgi:transposase-like protein
MSAVKLALSKIRTDGGTQPRAALDLAIVEEYGIAMEDGAEFPPVDAFYDGTNYWLADGFHRCRAAWNAHLKEIAATVHQGTQEDAQWYSFSANKANGLRRTNEDKQRAVKAALKHPRSAGMSDNAVAAYLGVGHATVSEWRQKLRPALSKMESEPKTRPSLENFSSETESPVPVSNASPVKRLCADGREMNVANIGRTRRAKQMLSTEPAVAGDSAPEPTPQPGEEPARFPKYRSVAACRRAARAEKIDQLVRSRRALTESMRHFLDLVNWLGETAGEFDEAQLLMSNADNVLTTASAELKQRAIAADPLNKTRFLTKE